MNISSNTSPEFDNSAFHFGQYWFVFRTKIRMIILIWQNVHQIIQNRLYISVHRIQKEKCVYVCGFTSHLCVCVCIFSCVCVYSVCNMNGLLSIFVIIIIRANWNVKNLLYVKIAVCLNVFISHFDGSDL